MSMQQVAQLAGVSVSTVSRVLSSDPRVAEETANAVREIAEKVGIAPALRRRRRGDIRGNGGRTTIAFLVFGTTGTHITPAFESLLRGVSDAAHAKNVGLALHFVSDPTELSQRLLRERVAGVLCHGEQPSGSALLKLQTLPTVWLMANRHRAKWGDQVMPNNAVIGDLAGRYLLRRGHRRLAYLSASPTVWSMRLRAFAFGKAAEDAGVASDLISAVTADASDYWSITGIAAAVDQMVDQIIDAPVMPTGLFVEEDRLLPVLDRALRHRGIRPGPDGDVEIVSCNNELAYYIGLPQQPTRIDIRAEAIGCRGVEQLLKRIENPGQVERMRIMIEPVLIEPAGQEPPVIRHLQDRVPDGFRLNRAELVEVGLTSDQIDQVTSLKRG